MFRDSLVLDCLFQKSFYCVIIYIIYGGSGQNLLLPGNAYLLQ